MRLLLPILLLCILAGCDAGGAGSDVELEGEPEIERSYTKSIEREASNDFEAGLIAAAEAAYPPRDSVLAAVRPEQHHVIPETGYWFCNGFDGVLIPYAITGDAVTYYSDLIDAIEAGEQLSFLKRVSLSYRAMVAFHEAYTFEGEHPRTRRPLPRESFEQVYVVEMSVAWHQYCGPLCAMSLQHERVVVFDASGELLRVFLDGPRPVVVS